MGASFARRLVVQGGTSSRFCLSRPRRPALYIPRAPGNRGSGARPLLQTEGIMVEKVVKSDAEWRAALTEEQYYVTRMKGTERPFTGAYCDEKAPGEYACVCCGASLFRRRRQVRFRHRVAELHQTGRPSQRRHGGGHQPRHAPGRGGVQPLRRSSRPRLPRRAGAHGAPLLHELRRAGADAGRRERVGGRRNPPAGPFAGRDGLMRRATTPPPARFP